MKFKRTDMSLQWFMDKRPYQKTDSYDRYYADLIKKVAQVFADEEGFALVHDCAQEEIINLSYDLVMYFEDIISQIGIWEAFVKKNIKELAKPVPFFTKDSSDYEMDEINLADIQFLIWNFLTVDNLHVYADEDAFRDLSKAIYDIFDAEFEKAPVTDFFKSFYKINPNTPFSEINKKLSWFSSNSYLLRQMFDRIMEEELENIAKEAENESAFLFNTILLEEQTRLHTASHVWSFKSNELLALIIDADDTVKKDIKDFSIPCHGCFKVIDQAEAHLTVESLISPENYIINLSETSEFQKIVDKEKPKYISAKLCKWGEYHYTNLPIFPETETEYNNESEAYLRATRYNFDKAYRESTDAKLRTLQQDFVDFWGDTLILNVPSKVFIAKLNSYHASIKEKYNLTKSLDFSELAKQFEKQGNVSYFFNPILGEEFVFHCKELLECLDGKMPDNMEDRKPVIDFISSNDVSAQFLFKLAEKQNLLSVLPYFGLPKDCDENDLRYFIHMAKPNDFERSFPEIIVG